MAYIKVNTQETRTFTNTYNRNETRCLMFCPYISTYIDNDHYPLWTIENRKRFQRSKCKHNTYPV